MNRPDILDRMETLNNATEEYALLMASEQKPSNCGAILDVLVEQYRQVHSDLRAALAR
jgi:hypothetical protein